MVDTELGSGCLKKGEKISFTIGKAICKFKTIIRLNTFHFDSMFSILGNHLFEKIGRRIGGLFRIGGKKSQTGKLLNGSILK